MFDNDGLTVRVTAPTGGVTAGDFVFESSTGWAGFALDTVDEGELVALEIARGHRFSYDKTLAATAGDVLYIQNDGSLALTADTTSRPFMKLTEVVEDVTDTEDQLIGVVLPQTWVGA